jgi:hypothetical protein
MRSAEKICSITGEGKNRVGVSGQKDKSDHHALGWLCLSRMGVSALTLLSLLRPMRRVCSGRMSDDIDNRCLLEEYPLLHDISLLFALLIVYLDTTMRSCSVSSAISSKQREKQASRKPQESTRAKFNDKRGHKGSHPTDVRCVQYQELVNKVKVLTHSR